VLRLVDHTARPVAVDFGRQCEPRPENDLSETQGSVSPVDESLGRYIANQKLDSRSFGHGAQGEQETRCDGRQQQLFGAPRVPGPVELDGWRRVELRQAVNGKGGMAARGPGEAHRVVVGQGFHCPVPCDPAPERVVRISPERTYTDSRDLRGHEAASATLRSVPRLPQ
jgi:hypothetical protein